MNYPINTSNYHTFEVFEVNKLPARSYFIPYPDRTGADAVSPKEKRYHSAKVICLNGEWDFKFYPRPAEMPVWLDTDKIDFDKIDVPACWQFRGYDKPFYVNIRYQFPYNPPVIPTTEKVGKVFSWTGVDQRVRPRWKDPGEQYNFVGVYRRFLNIDDSSKNYVIDFMGVASCMDLYFNGEFVGYSEGTHNITGFDLSGKLKAGENEIVVVVHRWCTGTYLEGQDMFRNNGIFRDVLLRISEPADLWDIDAKTKKTDDAYSLTLKAETLSDTDVTFTLEGHGVSKTATISTKDKIAQVTFAGLAVTEWTAEDPVLYNIYFETPSGCVKGQFPIKAVECAVADMTEPNIRPQESGNRMDCTAASLSDGKVRVCFEAVDAPFELGIKPYTDKALCAMKHRKDEVRTGTYVTIQAFQQGIGTGACGPNIMPEFRYSAKKDYTLKFLIRVGAEGQ